MNIFNKVANIYLKFFNKNIKLYNIIKNILKTLKQK